MKVRKLLVTDIRCRTCGAGTDEICRSAAGFVLYPISNSTPAGMFRDGVHGERIAEHAELERAGWDMWQEVDPRDDGAGREERTEARGGK